MLALHRKNTKRYSSALTKTCSSALRSSISEDPRFGCLSKHRVTCKSFAEIADALENQVENPARRRHKALPVPKLGPA